MCVTEDLNFYRNCSIVSFLQESMLIVSDMFFDILLIFFENREQKYIQHLQFKGVLGIVALKYFA